MRYPPKSLRASAAGSRSQRTVIVRPRSAIESAPACQAPGYDQTGTLGNCADAVAGIRVAVASSSDQRVARPRGAGQGEIWVIVALPGCEPERPAEQAAGNRA